MGNRNSRTQLIDATLRNRIEEVEECLAHEDSSAMCLAKDAYGSALIHAVRNSRKNVVSAILSSGLRVKMNFENKDGFSPLLYACRSDNEEMCQMLVDHKACDVNFGNKIGTTALLMCASNECFKAMKVLLSCKDIDVNAQNKRGANCLMLLAYKNSVEGLGMLLERNDVDYNLQNGHGFSAMMLASSNNSYEVAKLLIERKEESIDFNLPNSYGTTCLQWAARNSCHRIVKMLTDLTSVEIHHKNKHGETALRMAVDENHSKSCKILLRHGASAYNWQEWKTNAHKSKLEEYEIVLETVRTMRKWRSFLPDWTPWVSQLYPHEFYVMAHHFLWVLKEKETDFGLLLGRDMKGMLVGYVSRVWKKIKDDRQYDWKKVIRKNLERYERTII